ncbi:hypothetical protein TELCIR_10318, partial [Teladorsagia circumcincta]
MAKVVVIGPDTFPENPQKYENFFKTTCFDWKERPYIASPFMPIATPLAIPLERRAPSSPKEARRNLAYGSNRRADEGLLADEEQQATSSTEEESASDEDESTISAKGSFAALSSKEWVTVVMLALANLCSTVAFSCIAPFYPDEAKKKGMTESQTGIVFGIFELVMFVMAPIFGRYEYPEHNLSLPETYFQGVMETFAGLGYTAGPVVGGILYEFGGFQVPFLVLGAILMVATALGWWLIENYKDDDVPGSKGMVAMLRIPVIWIMVYAVVVCAISLSFLDPTLSAHLQSFNLSPAMIGLMFLLCGGIYTLSAPVWGLLIDRNLIVIGISLAVLGVAAGALYIPTFQSCLDAVNGFMGPTVGGFVVEKIGFAWTTTIIGAIHVMFVFEEFREKKHNSSCETGKRSRKKGWSAARGAGIDQLMSELAKLCREAMREDLKEQGAAALAEVAEAKKDVHNARR